MTSMPALANLVEFDASVLYSYGVGVRDSRPVQRAAASFAHLAGDLKGSRAPAVPPALDAEQMRMWKAQAALPWIAQPLGGDGRRAKANARPWPLLLLDVDGVEATASTTASDLFQQLVRALRTVAPCFGWTTASHTATFPRARIVLALARPIDAPDAKRLACAIARHLSEVLGVTVGPAGSTVVLDESMQDAVHIAFCCHEDGDWIELSEDVPPVDVDQWLAKERTSAQYDSPRRPHTLDAEAEVREALARVDQRHPDAVDDRKVWLKIVASLKAFGWPEAIMEPIARAWSEQSSKFDPDRWRVDWGSLQMDGGITPATLFHYAGRPEEDCPAYGTDDGTACRFAKHLMGRAMYARGRFYSWTGAYWKADNGQLAAWLKDFLRTEANKAARAYHSALGDRAKETTYKASRQLLNQNVQERILRALATVLRVDDDALDRDPYLLACANGTVDLKSGALKSADPEDRITLCTGHDFDPEASCPTWSAFIAEALGDPDTVDWFQRFMGLCATGDVSQEKMLLAIGPSGTGKSTALKAVMHALGGETAASSYATAGSSSLLADTGRRRSAHEHTAGLTPLVGKRLVAVNEVKRGEAWDDSVFKQIVSREPIQMRESGGARAFIVLPTWKLWVRGNFRPNIKDVTDAFFRRVAVLEFNRKPQKADYDLDARLQAEAAGILAWIVQGAVNCHERGLALPSAMQAALDSYRSEQDLFGEWLAARTEPGGFTAGEELRNDYCSYAGLGRRPVSDKAFASMMRERSFEPKKHGGKRGFGVVFRSHAEDFDVASLV